MDNFGSKIETLGGFKKHGNIYSNFTGTPLGPRAGMKARGFQSYFVGFHEYHPRFNFWKLKYPLKLSKK